MRDILTLAEPRASRVGYGPARQWARRARDSQQTPGDSNEEQAHEQGRDR